MSFENDTVCSTRKATKVSPVYESPYNPDENRGILRAYKMVQITDLYGNTRMCRVSLGREYSISVEKAKIMVNNARNADSDPGSIGAHISIYL